MQPGLHCSPRGRARAARAAGPPARNGTQATRTVRAQTLPGSASANCLSLSPSFISYESVPEFFGFQWGGARRGHLDPCQAK